MQTDNCAILTPDVLADVTWLLDACKKATPAEFHALNSLVEAVVFHEKLYLYGLPTNYTPSLLYNQLVEHEVISTEHSAKIFEAELKSRQMEDLARDVLLDRTFGNSIIGYNPDHGLELLSSLVDYEKNLGFARMSKMHDDNEDLAILFANTLNFSRKDTILIDDTYRRARAFAACASELGLEMYTGIITRSFLLGFLSARRRGSLGLYEQMKKELDDVDDTDLPSWKRIEVPPLTLVLLRNCKDSPNALPSELLKMRYKLREFRKTLTEQTKNLKIAKNRGEKRKVRREMEKAWAALLEKEDRSTRIAHQLWDITKNPLKAPIAAIDKAIDKDKLNQAILKVQGLTDLWRTLFDAPTIEQNVELIKKVFAIDVQFNDWKLFAEIAGLLESVSTRNDEQSLPSIK